jgi:hypothetical protein
VRPERSLVDVFDDIFGNLQDIVRSEIRLARAEVSQELSGAKSAAIGWGFALLAGAFSLQFALFAAMYALSMVMARWIAALAIAGAMTVVALCALLLARRRAGKQRARIPRSAVEIREEAKWASQSTR